MRTPIVVLSATLVLLAVSVKAQVNTSSFPAAPVVWGQHVASAVGPGAATQYWFIVIGLPGRSYCVEAGNFESAVPGTGTWGDHSPLVNLSVYRFDGTTLVAAATITDHEPYNPAFARVCWIPTVVDNYKIKVFPGSVPAAANIVTLHFVETTLFCPWFFIAGDYNAFSLLRNSSGTSLSGVVITWRGLNGTIAGTTTVSIPANGGVVVNARDFVNPGVFSNGTIEVVHTGSPGQLSGSTTTLSGTTGIGFDAQFTARPTW